MDHDDLLADHALAVAVLTLSRATDPAIVYSDEDHIDDTGRRLAPYFKPDFDPLLHLIESLIEPESWSEVGGPGQVRPLDITQSLIVRQTARVHAQIRIALDELRKLRIEAPDEKR